MGTTFEVKNTGEVLLKLFSSDPVGVEGEIIYNTTEKKLKYYNGTIWQQLPSDPGVALGPTGGTDGPSQFPYTIHMDASGSGYGLRSGNVYMKKYNHNCSPLFNISGTGGITSSQTTYTAVATGAYIGYLSPIPKNSTTDWFGTGAAPQSGWDWTLLGTLYSPTKLAHITHYTKEAKKNFTDLANPVTDYSTWGSSLTLVNLNDITQGDGDVYTSGLNNSYVVLKYILTSAGAALGGEFLRVIHGHDGYGGEYISIRMWNFTTSTWDTPYSYNAGGGYRLGGSDVLIANYVSGNIMYFKVACTAVGSSFIRLRMLSLMKGYGLPID